METSLSRIFDLLEENAPSLTAYQSTTPEGQETLSVLLVSGPNVCRLELQQDGESRSWEIFEKDYSTYFATLESFRKAFQSMKYLPASSFDQLSLWPSESSK